MEQLKLQLKPNQCLKDSIESNNYKYIYWKIQQRIEPPITTLFSFEDLCKIKIQKEFRRNYETTN